MSALNHDNAQLRKEITALGAGSRSTHVSLPLGAVSSQPGDDESGAAPAEPRNRSTLAADLRRELASASEVDRLQAKIADIVATAAQREGELSAQLESQRRARAELEYRLGSVDFKAMQRDVAGERQQQLFFAEQVSAWSVDCGHRNG
jgi:hypothetical protein